MSSSCQRHPFDRSAGECRTCGQAFCPDCLVYAHGPDKPPFCIPCALVAAGVSRRRTPARAGRRRFLRAS